MARDATGCRRRGRVAAATALAVVRIPCGCAGFSPSFRTKLRRNAGDCERRSRISARAEECPRILIVDGLSEPIDAVRRQTVRTRSCHPRSRRWSISHRRSTRQNVLSSPRATHLTSSARDDDPAGRREDEAPPIPPSKWSALREGALHVHENFLDLFFPAYHRALRAALSVVVGVGATYRASPSLGCRFMDTLRAALLASDWVGLPVRWMASALSSLMVLAASVPLLLAFTAAVMVPALARVVLQKVAEQFPNSAPLETMAKALTELCVRIGGLAAAVGTVLKQKATEMQDMDQSGMLVDSFSENPVLFPLSAFVVGPFGEELICRGFLQTNFKRLFRLLRSQSEETSFSDTEGITKGSDAAVPQTICGHTPWALASSLLFAAAHSANWTGPLRGMKGKISVGNTEILGTATFLMAMALSQVAVSLYLSLWVYAPIYERKGVWASVGAHAMWNISLFFTLPFRIARKAWLIFKVQIKK